MTRIDDGIYVWSRKEIGINTVRILYTIEVAAQGIEGIDLKTLINIKSVVDKAIEMSKKDDPEWGEMETDQE